MDGLTLADPLAGQWQVPAAELRAKGEGGWGASLLLPPAPVPIADTTSPRQILPGSPVHNHSFSALRPGVTLPSLLSFSP